METTGVTAPSETRDSTRKHSLKNTDYCVQYAEKQQRSGGMTTPKHGERSVMPRPTAVRARAAAHPVWAVFSGIPLVDCALPCLRDQCRADTLPLLFPDEYTPYGKEALHVCTSLPPLPGQVFLSFSFCPSPLFFLFLYLSLSFLFQLVTCLHRIFRNSFMYSYSKLNISSFCEREGEGRRLRKKKCSTIQSQIHNIGQISLHSIVLVNLLISS